MKKKQNDRFAYTMSALLPFSLLPFIGNWLASIFGLTYIPEPSVFFLLTFGGYNFVMMAKEGFE